MGAEGSISSMISSLRNNKNLLRRRRTFFDRKRSFSELKKMYAQKAVVEEKPLTEEAKRKIREQLRADFKRQGKIDILLLFGSVILVAVLVYFVISGLNKRYQNQETTLSLKGKYKLYDETINNGLIFLNNNEPFFAIGHFENALEMNQNDSYVIEKLIQSYQMLCNQNEMTCEKVKAKIDHLREKKIK